MPCFADDESRFQYELAFETGLESTFDPDATSSEVFFNTEIGMEYQFSSQVVGFVELSLESELTAEGGMRSTASSIEVGQLGLNYSLGASVLSVGKISPQFGSANDTVQGYFAGDFVEDYEIEKAYGLIWAFDQGDVLVTASASLGDRFDQDDGPTLPYL